MAGHSLLPQFAAPWVFSMRCQPTLWNIASRLPWSRVFFSWFAETQKFGGGQCQQGDKHTRAGCAGLAFDPGWTRRQIRPQACVRRERRRQSRGGWQTGRCHRPANESHSPAHPPTRVEVTAAPTSPSPVGQHVGRAALHFLPTFLVPVPVFCGKQAAGVAGWLQNRPAGARVRRHWGQRQARPP